MNTAQARENSQKDAESGGESPQKRPRKRRFVKITGIAVALLALSSGWAFALGPLRPFSPIILGLNHQDTTRARIYYHSGADLTPFQHIDGIIQQLEASHHLTFPRTVDILLCKSDAEHRHYAHTNAQFCVLPVYGRLSVSLRAQNNAKNQTIHMDTYLTHELSHTLLIQNMKTPLTFIHFPDWFIEGLAVYQAQQRGVDGYLTRGQTAEKIREGFFLSPAEFVQKPWLSSPTQQQFPLPNKYWFIYSELACFIEDLIQTNGEGQFLQYQTALLQGDDSQDAFARIFGKSFDDDIAGFRKRMVEVHE